MAEARIVVTAADPAGEAGARLAQQLSKIERPRLAIPGGSAMRALAGVSPELWRRVRLTWVDERCVPFGDPDSNRGDAWRAGLLRREAAPEVELALFEDGETPEAACARVRAALRERFEAGLDVALLGMGEDGHIASLFPGGAVEGDLVAAVAASPKPPARRVTLTLPMLQTARSAILLATGEGKRGALLRLMDGDPALPASALESLTVITDLRLSGGGRQA